MTVSWNSGGEERADAPNRRCRLFSATILVCEGGTEFIGFHASTAMDRAEVVVRLAAQFGADLAERAVIRVGFDPTHPLLSPEVAKLLQAAVDQGSETEQRIDVSFERRIVS